MNVFTKSADSTRMVAAVPVQLRARLNGRLARRITLAVFASVFLIEAVVLAPFYQSFKRGQFDRIEQVGRGLATSSFRLTQADVPLESRLARFQQISTGTPLVGAALFDSAGANLGSFGEAPQAAVAGPLGDGGRYDVLWGSRITGLPINLVARFDTGRVQEGLTALIWRIAGMALLVAAFATAATLLILGRRATPGSGFVATDEDIAERTRIEEENARLSAYQTENPNPGITASASGEILFANPTARSLVGAIGLNGPSELLPQDHVTVVRRALSTQQGQFGLESAVGERIFNWTYQPLGGGIVRIYGMDVTEMKHAEAALRESELRFRSVAHSAVDAIVSADGDGNIIHWNRSAEKIFGYQEFEMLGQSVTLLIPESYRDAHNAGLARFKRTTEPEMIGKTIQMHGRRKDGSEFPLEMSLAAWNCGAEIYFTSTLRDITERLCAVEEREDLMEQFHNAQKMEAIGTLAGGIAHDFNNILSIVLGHAEILTRMVPEEDPVREGLNEIIVGGQRAIDLVKQILAFSRQCDKHLTPVRIDKLVREAMKMLRATLPTTIRLKTKVQDGLGTVTADETQLHQVIMNLCINAGHAIGTEPGVIKVTVAEIDSDGSADAPLNDRRGGSALRVLQNQGTYGGEGGCIGLGRLKPGRYVKIMVGDTGCGMDQITLKRIFDPFFTTKGVGVGTGLGLAAVEGIVRTHGGAITVETERGKGTRFKLFLPVSGEEAVTRAAPDDGDVGGEERILVIDDEPGIVTMIHKGLEMLGYRVTGFTDSLAALRAFESASGDWDLIITDHTMPNLTGVDLAKRALRARPDIPIVLCSGYIDTIDNAHVTVAGIQALLVKPVVGQELAHTVRRVLDAAKPAAAGPARDTGA